MSTNYKSWRFTAKLIRILHNRDIKKHYRQIGKSNPKTTRNNNTIENGLLIYPNDSALAILNKQILFRNAIQNQESELSHPESWLINSRQGNDIPQLVIIYRIKNNNKSGSYQVTIPHYNGSKSISPPEYMKGNEPIVFKMKDNSSIVMNCADAEAGKKIIKYFLGFCSKRFIENSDNFIYPSKTKVKKNLMRPIRADFYKDGEKSLNPTWRIYF